MIRLARAAVLLGCAVAASGCFSAPPSDTPKDPRLRNTQLVKALERADGYLADEDFDQAYRWFDHAAALDGGRTADLKIAEGKFECARQLAIEGVGVDMFGLVADRREGIQWLLGVVRDYRFSDVAPKALYWAAVGYRLIGEPDVGVLAADRLIRNYPESAWAEAAEYERVLSLLDAARAINYDGAPLAEAQWRLEMYEHLHPAGANRGKAGKALQQIRDYRAEKDFRVAEWYAFQDHTVGARFYYEEVVRRFPKTDWAEQAQERIDALPPAPSALDE